MQNYNRPVPVNPGIAPGSSVTFGDLAPQFKPTQSAGAPVTVKSEQYPSASGPVTHRVAAVVGEWLCFGGGSLSITRMPPAPKGWDKRHSIGVLDGLRFCARLPGLYVAELGRGDGFVKRLEIIAADPAWLSALQLDDAHAQRRRWRSVCNDVNITSQSAIDALEKHPFEGGDTFGRLLNVQVFGAQNFGV